MNIETRQIISVLDRVQKVLHCMAYCEHQEHPVCEFCGSPILDHTSNCMVEKISRHLENGTFLINSEQK